MLEWAVIQCDSTLVVVAIIMWQLKTMVTIMCHNNELSLRVNWIGRLLPDSEFLMLFAGNSQILLKIFVILIFWTGSPESVSKQPTQIIFELNLSLRHIIVTLVMMKTVAVDASTQNPYPWTMFIEHSWTFSQCQWATHCSQFELLMFFFVKRPMWWSHTW